MSSGNCFINEGAVTGYQDKKQAIRTQTQIGVSSEKLLSNSNGQGNGVEAPYQVPCAPFGVKLRLQTSLYL
jgi:hypothetical protein